MLPSSNRSSCRSSSSGTRPSRSPTTGFATRCARSRGSTSLVSSELGAPVGRDPEGAVVLPVDDDDWFAPDIVRLLESQFEPGRIGLRWTPSYLEARSVFDTARAPARETFRGAAPPSLCDQWVRVRQAIRHGEHRAESSGGERSLRARERRVGVLSDGPAWSTALLLHRRRCSTGGHRSHAASCCGSTGAIDASTGTVSVSDGSRRACLCARRCIVPWEPPSHSASAERFEVGSRLDHASSRGLPLPHHPRLRLMRPARFERATSASAGQRSIP